MSNCLILYLLDHKACIVGAESIEIPDHDHVMSGAYKHIFRLHATGPQHFSTPHVNFKDYYLLYGTMR